MTDRVEQQICIKFCIKIEHSTTEAIQMIQKAAAVGNWWLAAASRHVHSCITSPAAVLGEMSNHPGDPALLQPRFGALRLLAFPQTKITFEREEISNHRWHSGKYDWAASWWQLGELCEVPRYLLWRRLRCHCPMYNVSWILYHLQ